MARMFPANTHTNTRSNAEVNIYSELKRQLPDSFTVIHSVPWLKSAANMLVESRYERYVPTGEIDFLILHAELGILAIEIKGGVYKYVDHSFLSVSLNEKKDVVGQIRRNVHGLSNWLGKSSHLRFRFGYAVMFPDSSFLNKSLPPALQDGTGPAVETIVIGKEHVPMLSERIVELMQFWKKTLGTRSLGEKNISEIVSLICPELDLTPTWQARVLFDNQMWLSLTQQQQQCLARFEGAEKLVVRGWPGTGKTLLAIETVKRLAAKNKRILVVTFNVRIAAHIRGQLHEQENLARVFHFHDLCKSICTVTGIPFKFSDDYDFSIVLNAGIEKNYFERFDAIVIDEGQILAKEWHESFFNAFQKKQALIFCDDAQIFSFEKEKSTASREICEIFGIQEPFILTDCLRSPKLVNETLQKISPPDFQIQCPRPFEEDAFKEIVADSPRKELAVQLHELINVQGLSVDDIVIIYPYWDTDDLFEEDDPFNKILRTNAAKYRGLECPVVILFSYHDLSSNILFSAFSRATSKVIAIYGYTAFLEAHKRGTYLHDVANRFEQDINTIRISRSVSEYFKNTTYSARKLNITTADIYWENNWKAWVVELHQGNPAGKFWVDYLSEFEWPILYWTERKEQYAHLHRGNRNFRKDDESFGNYSFLFCEVCEQVTPHKMNPGSSTCGMCMAGSVFEFGPGPGSEKFRELESFDSVIVQNVAGQKIINKALPIALVSMGITMFAVEKGCGDFSQILTYGGRVLHRAAYSIILANAAIKYPRSLKLDVLVRHYYERYESLANGGIDMKEWHSAMATAYGVQVKAKLLTKSKEGKREFIATAPLEDGAV